MIKFSNICKSYGERVVLNNLTGIFAHQKMTSLIGPNGAGKSTLLSVVSRLLQQDAGEVTLDDRAFDTYKKDELAQKISILKQSNHVDTKLTVRELVSFGRFPYSKGRLTKDDRLKIDQALAFSELQDIADSYINELSGGQRQRAFISMIIAQDTDYLLLDEPLNNLDMKHSVQVMKTLRRLVDELGKTVIIVIHEINFASNYSDHIIAMKNGNILYDDITENIINADVLNEVFDIDFNIIQHNNKMICNYFNL